jgi:hypothetical protein
MARSIKNNFNNFRRNNMKKIILALVLTVSTIGMASAEITISTLGDATYISNGTTTITCGTLGGVTRCN